jgi:fumarate reductase flavoprotein subunit
MPRGPWQEEGDLLVVGASICGLTAAIMAADRGCRTILLERTRELGGGAASESEVLAAAGSRFQREAGIADDPARLLEDLRKAHHPVDAEVAGTLAAEGAPLVAWLADRCGTQIELLATHVPPGHSVARLHLPGERGGATLLADLTRTVTRHSHVTIRTNTVVERLIRDDSGAVRGVGVRADRRGGPQVLGGRVLLACGGFAGDDALVREHIPVVAELPFSGTGRATGDGLRLGSEVGARVQRLGGCLVTPFLAMPGQLAVTAPLVEQGAILVDQRGQRFADETGEHLALATAVRARPGRVAYLLFDERIAASARNADPFFARVVLPRTGRRGATLEDIAKQFEVDLNGLRTTIDQSTGQGGDPFGRSKPPGPFEPPFHAIRVTGARLRTLGGLAVDASARVVDAEGRTIPGLYAAGGAAAGLAAEVTSGVLAGMGALAALGLARRAALEVISQVATRAE